MKLNTMNTIVKYSFVAAMLFLFWGCTEDTVEVEKKGSITGTVTDKETGLPIENVKVTTNPVSSNALTDAEGKFTISNVLVDDYSVQAEIEEYVTAFEPVTVLEDEIAIVILEMSKRETDNIPPLEPILVSPEDNATDVPATVDFVWNSSSNDSDEITYSLELRNGNTNEITLVEEISDTTYTIENLERGVNYVWQVKADDGTNDPVSSSLSGFTTASNASDNRFYFVKKIGDNNVIFSGTDSEDDFATPDENLIQITQEEQNSFRPRQSTVINRVAFLRNVGANTHLFIMDRDGSNIEQLTQNVPVAGFRQDELDFTWYQNGSKIYYPNFNRIYSITFAGNANTLVYTAPEGEFISEIAANDVNNLIAIKTNDASGYNAKISIVNPNTGIESVIVVDGLPGALGGIDFSADGTKVLYTRDVSGFENAFYRQLDSRIFIYDIVNDETVEVDTDKPSGFNDLDVKYSPNEGSIIFTSTSNDGLSPKQIVRFNFDDISEREIIFTNASMPDWQ